MSSPDDATLEGLMVIVQLRIEAGHVEDVTLEWDDWEPVIETSNRIPVFFLVTLRCLSGARS